MKIFDYFKTNKELKLENENLNLKIKIHELKDIINLQDDLKERDWEKIKDLRRIINIKDNNIRILRNTLLEIKKISERQGSVQEILNQIKIEED